MSSTTTPSEDEKLYMTEDLEGRLDPASLEEPEPVPKVEAEKDFYSLASGELTFPMHSPLDDLPPPPKVVVMFQFPFGDALTLEGSLSALSFGAEGWLCTFGVEESKDVLSIVLKAAKDTIQSVVVSLPGGNFSMFTKVDCTATFSYGSATFTVTADEAHYVYA